MTQPELRSLLDATLCLPTSAIAYRMGASLSAAFTGRAVLETRDVDFDPWRFERDGHASMEWRQEVHSQRTTAWHRTAPHLSEDPHAAWARMRWDGHTVDVVRLEWREGFEGAHRYWVVAETRAIAEAFLSAVCAWCHLPRRELLVFSGNCWSKSHPMWAS